MAAVNGLFKKDQECMTQIRNLLTSARRLMTNGNMSTTSGGHSPWLRRLGDLLQPAARLLQLRQRVGRWKWRHGRVLDERVSWVMAAGVGAAADATSAPGVAPVGERLAVQRAGLPQALGAVEGTLGE